MDNKSLVLSFPMNTENLLLKMFVRGVQRAYQGKLPMLNPPQSYHDGYFAALRVMEL